MESSDETYIALLIFAEYEFVDTNSGDFNRTYHIEKIQSFELAVRFLNCQKIYDEYKPSFRGILISTNNLLVDKYDKAVSFEMFSQLFDEEKIDLRKELEGLELFLNSDSFSVESETLRFFANEGLFSITYAPTWVGGLIETARDEEGSVNFNHLMYNRRFLFYDSPIVYHAILEARRIEPNMFGLITLINRLPYSLNLNEFNKFFEIDLLNFKNEFDSERISYSYPSCFTEIPHFRHYTKNKKIRLYIHREAAETIAKNSNLDLVINVESVIKTNGYIEYYVNGVFGKKQWEFLVDPIDFWI